MDSETSEVNVVVFPCDDFFKFSERLIYSPDTGEFCWKSGVNVGRKAGYANRYTHRTERRYWCINVLGKKFKGHRVAWLLMTGHWPKNLIDHIDGDGLNNRFENLRDVDQFVNMRNETNKNKKIRHN
jgi:hypothetical protein